MLQQEYDVTKPLDGNPGAVGDGRTDNSETEAIQRCLDAACQPAGGTVYFPPGVYFIKNTLHIKKLAPLKIHGAGLMTTLIWSFDNDLFRWDAECFESTVQDLRIISTFEGHMTPASTAFHLPNGADFSSIARIRIDVDDPNTKKWGSGIRVRYRGINQTKKSGGQLRFDDLNFWRFCGTAIELMDVVDVRIRGCRFPAIDRPLGSIGIHLAGSTGGVCVENCDLSEIDYGIRIDRTGWRKPPSTPLNKVTKKMERAKRPHIEMNHELFCSGLAGDLCSYGLYIDDDTFATITGAWFASCDFANIYTTEGYNPVIEITGGINFNAGHPYYNNPQRTSRVKYPGNNHHGIIIQGGELAMNGVMVKQNKGIGLIIGEKVKGYTVSGCTFTGNSEVGARILKKKCGSVTGNFFIGNKKICKEHRFLQYDSACKLVIDDSNRCC